MLALQIALGFGIAILLPMLAYYATCSIFPRPQGPFSVVKPGEKKTLEQQQKDQEEYRTQSQNFQKKLFYIACSIGFCALAAGPFLAVKAVGTGLMFGGVSCIIEGVGCCWNNLNPKMKFAFLLGTMVVLIVIGYRNFAG